MNGKDSLKAVMLATQKAMAANESVLPGLFYSPTEDMYTVVNLIYASACQSAFLNRHYIFICIITPGDFVPTVCSEDKEEALGRLHNTPTVALHNPFDVSLSKLAKGIIRSMEVEAKP